MEAAASRASLAKSSSHFHWIPFPCPLLEYPLYKVLLYFLPNAACLNVLLGSFYDPSERLADPLSECLARPADVVLEPSEAEALCVVP